MSNSRKPAPIRQFSLHADTSQRRKGLKKQFSEDIPDSKEKWIPELGFHVSLCTKSQVKTLDRPPPAKQAWIENRHQEPLPVVATPKAEEGIIAKKCKEIKRPVTAKVVRQSSLNKDSILLSHQELAERLRQAWKDREKGKQNLNIFLAHNIKEKQDDEFNDLTDSEGTFSNENAFDKIAHKPKIILPLKPDVLANNELNYKNVFQKRMRRTHSVDEPLTDLAYSPTRTLEARSRAVVVVPLVENTKTREVAPPVAKIESESKEVILPQTTTNAEEKPTKDEQAREPDRKNSLTEEGKSIDVIIRPMTANSKREGFRSRTNSAFNGSNGSVTKENQRPPLVRASSVPLKQAPPKPKFISVKRRIKSAQKRREKSEKLVESDDEIPCEEEDEDGKSKNKKFQRCVSVSGAEIITMVSLISPEDSDAEEQAEAEKEKPKSKTSSPTKTVSVEKPEKIEHQKTYALRKAVKSVSFQQSSIHAVRSFSASFPARRGSVATALMLGNSGLAKQTSNNHTAQEKRGTLENVSEEAREPKRRLVRTKSAPSDCSFDEKEDDGSLEGKAKKTPTQETSNQSAQQPKGVSPNASRPSSGRSCKSATSEQKEGVDTEENPDADPTFDTPKEKQCWDMYCKMSGKGVNISFDTILRGMLTPTEYRLRRKSLVVAESENNIDNIADS